eukprot:TRINITY_DN5190_c0_g1_i2.p1 TRINITY_DN5190_c0_g1~~TRINITY_DN5190_c0_g1_i2.p1  ORF type:complete len:225 (-),score=32.18 TRINITY_DN5190_c0_g1_i2:33-707(-)
MNIFLFAPGLLLLLILRFGVLGSIPKLSICAVLQLILGLPFLLDNPVGYIARSFNLGRVFIYFWSVNWKFIPEDIFLSKEWGLGLLFLTVAFWALFCLFKWLPKQKNLLFFGFSKNTDNISPEYITAILFSSNFIGIVFSRSLHYQFYVWYFHTLVYLLWFITGYPVMMKIAIMAAIEVSWNIFPSNETSSMLLFASHIIMLIGLWFTDAWDSLTVYVTKKKME